MTLFINTAGHHEIVIGLMENGRNLAIKKIKAERGQAEKLLPAIDKLLRLKKIKLSALKKIVVCNQGGSFTSLRIGVVTANALGYALNIPVEAESGKKVTKKFAGHDIVEPEYDAEPNIGKSRQLVH